MTGLAIMYDQHADVVVISGVKYSGEMFRTLALASPGTWLRITQRRDGVIAVRQVEESVERTFDAIIGQRRATTR